MPSDNPPSEAIEFEPGQRLHPLSWLFILIGYLRQLIIPALAFLLFGVRDEYAVWTLAFIVPTAAAAVWRQVFFRYGPGPDGLVVRSGLFFRKVRHIDYSRIESIETERNPLHRLLGVARVRIETSSGGKPEASIEVLSLEAAHELRVRIFARQQDRPATIPAQTPGEAELLLKLPVGEVIRFGLISNRGMLVVAAAFGVLAQSGMLGEFYNFIAESFDDIPATFGATSIVLQFLLGGVVLAALLILLRLLSVALALFTLYDFTLTRERGELRIRHGLLTRRGAMLRQRRIQLIRVRETLLHRLFGRVSVEVDIAGGAAGGGENGENAASAQELWLAPVCAPARARELVAAALPGAVMDSGDWRPLAVRAPRRLIRRNMLLALLAMSLLALWSVSFWAYLLLVPALPAAWLQAVLYAKHTRWSVAGGMLLFRSGWLNRRLAIVPLHKIQAARLVESPFDRRYRMARVELDTAGSRGHQVIIPYLDYAVAQALQRRLYTAAAYALPLAGGSAPA